MGGRVICMFLYCFEWNPERGNKLMEGATQPAPTHHLSQLTTCLAIAKASSQAHSLEIVWVDDAYLVLQCHYCWNPFPLHFLWSCQVLRMLAWRWSWKHLVVLAWAFVRGMGGRICCLFGQDTHMSERKDKAHECTGCPAVSSWSFFLKPTGCFKHLLLPQ